MMAKWETTVIYVDDGNSTLYLSTGVIPSHIHSLKWKLVSLLCRMKRIRCYLYTIFPIEKYDGLSIFHLPFNDLFANYNHSVKQAGVFIIGTNTSVLNIDVEKYQNTLKQISDNYSNKEPIIYCPHRRDHNVFDDFCQDVGIQIFDTEVSVEFDFIKNKIFPKIIIGFGSTALYTLKKLYPQAEVYNIEMERSNNYDEECFKYVSSLYEKEGIINCTMDSWQ
jgi:hypothetical protein